MSQLEHIEAIEKRLWAAADSLRANSGLASNEYFLPVMGLIFLRHAYSRFLVAKDEIVKSLPSRGGVTRALTKEDFSSRGALFLRDHAQFDNLVNLPDGTDFSQAIITAMESIEADYDNLKDQLPKEEYRQVESEVLGFLLRTLNPDELKNATGDIFGRIYEYFLTGFAGLKAHDGGEFFTPVSLVEFIANTIEPKSGRVLDPACGSGGMFVQSAHFLESLKEDPSIKLTFYGMEKNPTTIRLAKMNLAVHGLQGNISQAISYYDDPLTIENGAKKLWGNVDYVMANPPFNVDAIDAKVETDYRLPFGIPGVNKAKQISNGNYLWISYFYSYLNEKGRAGFVMSSQASSAGGDEKKVRKLGKKARRIDAADTAHWESRLAWHQENLANAAGKKPKHKDQPHFQVYEPEKLIKTGHVDVMVDVRGNFFYTRTVPCQLWFLDKGKPANLKDSVLMLDARQVFRQVNRTICDFSPEQRKNLTAIVWLYRGETSRYLTLLSDYVDEFFADTNTIDADSFISAFKVALKSLSGYALAIGTEHSSHTAIDEMNAGITTLIADFADLKSEVITAQKTSTSILDQAKFVDETLQPISDCMRDLIRNVEHLYKTLNRVIETAEKDGDAKSHSAWDSSLNKGKTAQIKLIDEKRQDLLQSLKQSRYVHKSVHWLTSKFPEARLVDIPGLVKKVYLDELEANDWSLTPGRYVGVAPEIVDENFDFEETMRGIKTELQVLNEEALELSAKIMAGLESLGI